MVELPSKTVQKRKRSELEGQAGNNQKSKKSKGDVTGPNIGTQPRGPYTKASRTTIWRNRKHAGDIRSFFKNVCQDKPQPATSASSSESATEGGSAHQSREPDVEVIELLDTSDNENTTHTSTGRVESQPLEPQNLVVDNHDTRVAIGDENVSAYIQLYEHPG